MTPEKVREVLQLYRRSMYAASIVLGQSFPLHKLNPAPHEQLMYIVLLIDALQKNPLKEQLTMADVSTIIFKYCKYFEKSEIIPQTYISTDTHAWPHQQLQHIRAMIADIGHYAKNGQLDKIKRHIGFIEGTLWSLGKFTLEGLYSKNTVGNEYCYKSAMMSLGFIQGVLWSLGYFSINDLRRHNMPKDEPFTPRDSRINIRDHHISEMTND